MRSQEEKGEDSEEDLISVDDGEKKLNEDENRDDVDESGEYIDPMVKKFEIEQQMDGKGIDWEMQEKVH